MGDYISRDAALTVLDWDCASQDALNAIKAIPAADVVAVVHGRWEQVEIIHVEDLKEEDKDCISIASMLCPKCKRYHNEVYIYGSPTESVRYCSSCGSKMDGGQDDV